MSDKREQWIFRVASTLEVGGGHMMRCISLALTLRDKARVLFILCSGSLVWQKKLDAIGLEYNYLEKFNISFVDGVLMDGYDFTDCDLKFWRKICKKFVVINDDPFKSIEADVIISPGIPEEHAPTSEKGNIILAGAKYALISDAYRNFCRANSCNEYPTVLISCGLNDSKNYNVTTLGVLQRLKFNGVANVALASSSCNLNSVKEFSKKCSFQVNIHFSTQGLSNLLGVSDLAIGAGGVSLMERMAAGVPSITIIAAENQRLISQWAGATGGTLVIDPEKGLFEDELLTSIEKTLSCKNLREKMSVNSKIAVDGLGCRRTADHMVGEYY